MSRKSCPDASENAPISMDVRLIRPDRSFSVSKDLEFSRKSENDLA
jgi:hypothetical protein